MEPTSFDTMIPSDELALGDTDHVLANPTDRYIIYSGARSGDMGVRDMGAGTFDLSWLNILTGTLEEQTSVEVAGGDQRFTPPNGFGAGLRSPSGDPACEHQSAFPLVATRAFTLLDQRKPLIRPRPG